MTVGGMLRSRAVRALLVFVIAATAIAARRWPQFISPDVWVEDGTQVIPGFAKTGWAGLFVPVNGYLIVPAKLISYVTLRLTFDNYAYLSTVIAVCVQAAVVAAIAVAPTILAVPLLAALLIPFLPVGSEVYALPLYTFWWTTLLLFTGLFWQDRTALGWRLGAIIVGGLSSPFVVAAWPIFAIRAFFERTRDNLIALAAAIVLAGIQGALMVREHANGVTPLDALHHIPTLISKYFGTPLYSLGQHGAGPWGLAVVIFLGLAILVLPKERRPVYVMLALCLGAALVTSISRVSVDAPHPILAGPRYFFFPLILTGWMLLMIAREGHRNAALAAMLIAGAYVPSLANAFTFEPQVPKEPWRDQVAACVEAEGDYTFDIQYGLPQIQWPSTMQGEDCRALEKAAWFDRRSTTNHVQTYPAGVP